MNQEMERQKRKTERPRRKAERESLVAEEGSVEAREAIGGGGGAGETAPVHSPQPVIRLDGVWLEERGVEKEVGRVGWRGVGEVGVMVGGKVGVEVEVEGRVGVRVEI